MLRFCYSGEELYFVQFDNSNNLSSTEYHIHKSLKIGKIFKIKFVGLAVANCPHFVAELHQEFYFGKIAYF